MMVAICDDNKLFCDELKAFLFQYKAERGLQIDVYVFRSGEALLADKRLFDIIFLDYQMPGLDGLSVAQELRRRSYTSSIVFVTSYPQFVFDSFEVLPYRFLCKPVHSDQIVSLMNGFIARQKMLAPLIVINDGEQAVVQAKDILYLEGAGKYCTVRTAQKTYYSSKTLAQVHELLPQHCFYRCHKSYVVNLLCIRSYCNDSAALTNGEAVAISRSKTAEFKRVYMRFIREFCVSI